jgi:hypothetical protein
MRRWILLTVISLTLILPMGAMAAVLTFDDIDPTMLYHERIPNGYGGLDWENMGYVYPFTQYSNTGYEFGLVSGDYVAYGRARNPALSPPITVTVSADRMDFSGAYLSSAWYDNNIITVEGWYGGALKYSTSVTVDVGNPTYYSFNYFGIDTLTMVSSNWQFVMDNFTYNVPDAISCVGFEPPCDDGTVRVNKNRALPLKAELFDADGNPITDAFIGDASPLIKVERSAGTPSAVDVTDDALPVGHGTEGNEFVYDEGKWLHNLKINNYSSTGIYTVTMESPDESIYVIDPTCTATFVIE